MSTLKNDNLIRRLSSRQTIEYLPTSALIADPRNTRKHSQKQIARLAGTIMKLGFSAPIVVDENGRILAGHARQKAAEIAGLSEVPCFRMLGLSDSEKKALSIADNKLGDMATFDMELLAETLLEIENVDFELLDATGFDSGEIDMIIGTDGFSGSAKADPGDDLPEMPPTVISKSGDLWSLGVHKVLCGNALEASAYETLLGDVRADMVFADMPYNVPINGHVRVRGRHREFAMASGEQSRPEFVAFLTAALGLAKDFSRDGSIHFQCMDHRHIGEMLEGAAAAGLEYKNLGTSKNPRV